MSVVMKLFTIEEFKKAIENGKQIGVITESRAIMRQVFDEMLKAVKPAVQQYVQASDYCRLQTENSSCMVVADYSSVIMLRGHRLDYLVLQHAELVPDERLNDITLPLLALGEIEIMTLQ